MPHRQAHATWEGNLMEGAGRMQVGSKAFDVPFAVKTRMGDEPGTTLVRLWGPVRRVRPSRLGD